MLRREPWGARAPAAALAAGPRGGDPLGFSTPAAPQIRAIGGCVSFPECAPAGSAARSVLVMP